MAFTWCAIGRSELEVQRKLLNRGAGAFALTGDLLQATPGAPIDTRDLAILYMRGGALRRIPISLQMARGGDGAPGYLSLAGGESFVDFEALMHALLPTMHLGPLASSALQAAGEWGCLQLQASRDSATRWLAASQVAASPMPRLACFRLSSSQPHAAVVTFLDHAQVIRHALVEMRSAPSTGWHPSSGRSSTFVIQDMGEWSSLGDMLVRARDAFDYFSLDSPFFGLTFLGTHLSLDSPFFGLTFLWIRLLLLVSLILWRFFLPTTHLTCRPTL
jgi:hypothetical protein